jgi:hypothetical protein
MHRTGECYETKKSPSKMLVMKPTSQQLVAERLQKEVEMKVDSSGIDAQRYEQSKKNLEKALGKIEMKEIAEALKKHEGNFAVEEALKNLKKLKEMKDHDPLFERFAKREVYALSDAAGKLDNKSAIGYAVSMLARTAEGLAGSKFPKDMKSQSLKREKQNVEEISKKREALGKTKVS